jgi:hypothetical protein
MEGTIDLSSIKASLGLTLIASLKTNELLIIVMEGCE